MDVWEAEEAVKKATKDLAEAKSWLVTTINTVAIDTHDFGLNHPTTKSSEADEADAREEVEEAEKALAYAQATLATAKKEYAEMMEAYRKMDEAEEAAYWDELYRLDRLEEKSQEVEVQSSED